MPRWTPDDIAWSEFDPSKLAPELLALVKAACLTEANAAQYTQYLKNVFAGDDAFAETVSEWQLEEEQHGQILGRYAEMADPSFNFAASFKKFVEGYVIPVEVETSVRGSRVGELQARCIVETGTSSFYSAMADATEEPVLKAIAKRIAADEFRHYRTFYDGIGKYQPIEKISLWNRLQVSIGRLKETDDDELAFAYHCGNQPDQPYDHGTCNRRYATLAYGIYQYQHAERATGMILKATGLKPNGWLGRKAADWTWKKLQARSKALAAAAA